MHRHRDPVNMAGLSDNVNTDALQRNTTIACVDPLPGFHIYSWSERHRNRVLPAFLTYQSRPSPFPPNPPKRPHYPDERSRLLLEGLQNNGRFVLTGILNDLEDERRAEEVRAKEALEAEHAELRRKEKAKQSAATGAATGAASIEPEEQAQSEQQTETEQEAQTERPTEAEHQPETEQQVETDQTRQRAPSFDPEFDEDRGIFSDPLAEFNGEDPFADFDGDHTHLHGDIDYGEDRGNLSESDSDDSEGYESDNEESSSGDDSSSEEGSDRDTEEGSSSEDEFHGTDPFADFDGDYTHLHTPFDFGKELTDESTSDEDSEFEFELGRAPESEQDVNQGLEQTLEQDHNIDNQDDGDMDSIDEILAAAHSADFTHEDGDEDEDMGDEVDLDYEDGDDIEDEDDHDLDVLPSAPFNPIVMGLKEIGGLAHFRVSSYKPGNGVDELKNDDTDRYWQYVFPVNPPFMYACHSYANL